MKDDTTYTATLPKFPKGCYITGLRTRKLPDGRTVVFGKLVDNSGTMIDLGYLDYISALLEERGIEQ